MTRIEIHVIDKNETVDNKDILELIHSNLIKCGLVEHPKINFGLSNKDKRKYVHFILTKELLARLQEHATATIIAGAKVPS